MTDRELDAARELLDHQLIDVNGRFCGKVDDLELTEPSPGQPPSVTAILIGPGVLARRRGSRFAALVGELPRRLHPRLDDGEQIPWRFVDKIDSAVHLTIPDTDLKSGDIERWCSEHVINTIPGAH